MVYAGSLVITDVLVAWEAEVVDHLTVDRLTAVMVVEAPAVTVHLVVWYIVAIVEAQATIFEGAVDLVEADM